MSRMNASIDGNRPSESQVRSYDLRTQQTEPIYYDGIGGPSLSGGSTVATPLAQGADPEPVIRDGDAVETVRA
jgi:hypothetical protein